MSLAPKQELIKSFFRKFEDKAERLRKLAAESFTEEAFTLCLVYIDRLASGYYGKRQNRKNFCRALKELSGNPLFGMIHPVRLREQTRAWCPSTITFIESITTIEPPTLLPEDKVALDIKNSTLTEPEKSKLISNVWRSSIADIAYDYIRNPEVHGSGSGGLSFGESVYKGQVGVKLDFEIFYDALREILSRVKEASIKTSHWFGNPNYFKEQS